MPLRHYRPSTSQWIVIVISAMACLALAWAYQSRISAFETSHQDLAQTSSAEVASQVGFILRERQRQVQLFAEDHTALLRALQAQPEDEHAHEEISLRLKRTFPTYFSFTIADSRGEPFITDFDGFVGDVCVRDIQAFAASGKQLARIHPNAHVYHFDVMSRWQTAQGATNLLMVSFEPGALGQLLKSIEAPGHELILALKGEPPVIEVTDQGGRDQHFRSDYRLTAEEMSRIQSRVEVPGSNWEVIDMVRPGFFEYHHRQVLRSLAVFLAAFALVVAASLLLLHREQQARKAAERAREDLVSVITHELRTPVTAISGTLSLLTHGVAGDLPPPLKSSLELLQRNAERLKRLINDLLESRRIESTQLSLQKSRINLEQVATETLSHLGDMAQQMEVRLELLEADDSLWVDADPVRVQQVLSNLVSNAAKYSPRGARVEVRLVRQDDKTVLVTVADHGSGIPKAFQPKVFEKFARGPAPQHRQVTSTGLGLNIVKSLVEAHGGTVGFDSVEGKGSTFYFTLPLSPSNGQSAEPSPEA